MYKLSNEQITAAFDHKGRLTALVKSGGENIIAAPAEDSFQLVFCKGGDWENTAFGRDQDFEASEDGESLSFRCKALRTKRTGADIGVTLRIALKEDQLIYTAEIENRDEVLITDFTYPITGEVAKLGAEKAPALLWPNQCGAMVSNIGKYLDHLPPTWEAHPYSLSITYPGGHAAGGSMQWMALTDGENTLSFSGRDEMFYASELRVTGGKAHHETASLMLCRLPFAQKGEIWQSAPVVLTLYAGDWHRAAREYRAWAETWRPEHKKPRWIEDMQGYFLVINKQQFGAEMWPYDQIPKLYELAQAHGFDTLGLFGWYDSGHDNQYPDLKVSESMGGTEALRENIRKVQERGGHVTLYHQGHLMEVTSEYYKNGGCANESVSRWGTPYYEAYNKAHKSRFLSHFTNKVFSNACPSSPAWQELMEEKTEFISGFGADGVLFDQIGGMYPYPCFNKEHPHALGKPSLSMSQGRRKLLGRLQKKSKEIGSEFCFMTEHVTDLYSAYADCLHGMFLSPFAQGERREALEGGEPMMTNFPELFRYCFPKTYVTVRNPAPYMTRRVANFCFLYGLKLEMEVRYEADKQDLLADKWPEYRQYGKAVSDLRRRYWQLLGRGEFRDTDPLDIPSPGLLAKAFVNGSQLAAALWNDSGEPISLEGFDAPGWTFEKAAALTGELSDMPKEIAPEEIMVILYNKKEVD
ncbi:MAG: hypothetical protein HFE92_05140 [Acutalibacter muris]|nr:hypothetical protein [Acutalibacter muris]